MGRGEKIPSLERRRVAAGLTYDQVAEKTGITKSTVYIHHKYARIPNLRDGLIYAHFYACSPEALLKGIEGASQ